MAGKTTSRSRPGRRHGIAVAIAAMVMFVAGAGLAVREIANSGAADGPSPATLPPERPAQPRAARATKGADAPPPAAAPPATHATATVSGCVLLFGRPVPGAVVAVTRIVRRAAVGAAEDGAPADDAQLPAPVRTAADGTFSVTVPGDAIVELAARDGDGRAVAREFRLPPAASAVVELDLPDGPNRLVGRVTTPDGAPWRGLVGARMESAWRVVCVPVDAEGRFALAGLGGSSVALEAEAAGSDPGDARIPGPVIELPHDGEVAWVVDDARRAISGTVRALETGEPVAGAAVRLSWRGRSTSVVTSADGAYRAEFRGQVWMRVTAPGFAPATASVDDGAVSQDISLVPGCTLRGVVVADGDGTPAAGALVIVQSAATGRDRAVRADADGRFEVRDLAAAHADACVAGGGWSSPPGDTSTRRHRLSPDRPAEVTLRAVRSARLVGRVVDPDGRPVAGAAVDLEQGCSFRGGDGRPLPPFTDADGRFEFEDCQPSVGAGDSLRVVATGWLDEHPRAPRLVAGATAETEIRLRAAREVVVEVTDDQATPLAGVLVTTVGGSRMQTRHTDAHGVARLRGLPAWGCAVVARARGWGTTTCDEEGTPPCGRVRITLAPGRTVSGIVRDRDGSPAEGVRVALSRPDLSQSGLEATTGPDGRFVIRDVGPGAWTAKALRGIWDVELPCVAGDDLQVRLRVAAEPPPHTLTVRAVGPDGRPVARFLARWGDASLSRDHASESSDGVACITIPGHARSYDESGAGLPFSAWDARDPAGRPLPFGPGQVRLREPWPDEVTITLPRGVVVEGRVLRPGGAPAGDARVVAGVRRPIDGGPPIQWVAETDSGPDGRFRFDTLPAEPVVLRAHDRRRSEVRSGYVSTESDTSGVELVLGD